MNDKNVKVEKGVGNIENNYGNIYFSDKETKDKPKTQLKFITFNNLNTKYTTPLTCSGLTEKDILVCPSNESYIRNILQNLELAHKCIIKGSSGSGKSLLTYQIAKKLYDDNWLVYKYNKNMLDEKTFQDLGNKVLIVVDDAQTLSMNDFKNIIEEACEKLFILMNWNIDSNDSSEFLRSYPSIDIIATEQVALIKQYNLEHQNEIIQVLRKLDINTSETSYWDNIEGRINRASQEKTPWLFNYALTEGWRKANEDMKRLSSDKELDLVLIVVATFQILTLDTGVEREIIIDQLRKYNKDEQWLNSANKIIDEFCIEDNERIVHKHYMYAKEVLYIFESYDKKENDKYSFFIDLLKELFSFEKYRYGYSSLLEFLMFDCRYCIHILNKEKFILNMTNHLFKSTLTEDTIKISNLNSLIRVNNDMVNVVEANIGILNQWILSVNSNTVLPLEELMNTLNNNKIKGFKLTNEMLEYVLSKITQSDTVESAKISSLYDRLHLFANAEQRKRSSKNIEKSVQVLNLGNSSLEVEAYHFSKIVTNLGRINEKWATKVISSNMTLMANAFNRDVLKAYSLYEKILYNYFGLISIIMSLGKKRNTRLAKNFIKQIDSKIIIKTFDSVQRFDIKNFATFLLFISVYDRKKIDDIICKIDFSNLKEIYKDDQELEHYHKSIIRILYSKKCQKYQDYIIYLIEKTEYLEKLLVIFNPNLAIEKLEKGKVFKMHFHGDEGYKFTFEFLKALEEEEKFDLVLKIINDNKKTIEDSIFNNISNVDRSNEKYEFLVYLFNKIPDFLKELFLNEEKVNKHIKKIYTLLRGKKIEKKMGNLYLFFIKKFSLNHQGDIEKLESQFPSTKKYVI